MYLFFYYLNKNLSTIIKMVDQKLFHTLQLQTKIILKPYEINTNNINGIILSLLKKKVGNKCINEGYVKSDSISIIDRSIGKINSSFLDGSVSFHIRYSAEVCKPNEEDILKAYVSKINDYGLSAKVKNAPLDIVIPKQLHSNTDIFKKIDKENANQSIIIKIIGKNYEFNSNKILVIAELLEVN